jgi:hypothetical protein
MILVSSVGVVTMLEGFTTEGSVFQSQREIHKFLSPVAFDPIWGPALFVLYGYQRLLPRDNAAGT